MLPHTAVFVSCGLPSRARAASPTGMGMLTGFNVRPIAIRVDRGKLGSKEEDLRGVIDPDQYFIVLSWLDYDVSPEAPRTKELPDVNATWSRGHPNNENGVGAIGGVPQIPPRGVAR